ncbi:hypothetical protein RCL06_24330, partial [Salmonella enterica subsp. enterica serovar Typhimurium]
VAFAESDFETESWSAENIDIQINSWLRDQQNALAYWSSSRTLFSANFAREAARTTLESMAATLPEYGSASYLGCWVYDRF